MTIRMWEVPATSICVKVLTQSAWWPGDHGVQGHCAGGWLRIH